MLLRTVVQIALEASTGLVGRSKHSHARRVGLGACHGQTGARARPVEPCTRQRHDRDPADAGVSIISVPDAAPPSAW